MKLGEMLRGCEPGKLQMVGNMAILPLVSELVWDEITSPANTVADGATATVRASLGDTSSSRVGTADYGTLTFENVDPNRDMVVPSHSAYLTKQAVQDHAMSTAGIVKRGGRQRFGNAYCVQASQGGIMQTAERAMIILPWQLRQAATMKRNDRSYYALWDSIGKYNRSFGIAGDPGNLVRFTDKYGEQLEQFIAEFEPVPKQVGAIIYVDGKLVGVERTPNHRYWRAVWPSLIRECYGSLAMATRDASRDAPKPPIQKRLDMRRIRTLEDLETELDRVQKLEDDHARAAIRELGEIEFTLSRDQAESTASGTLAVHTVEDAAKRFSGQVVQRDDVPVVYTSLVTTQYYHKHGKWNEAPAFSV